MATFNFYIDKESSIVTHNPGKRKCPGPGCTRLLNPWWQWGTCTRCCEIQYKSRRIGDEAAGGPADGRAPDVAEEPADGEEVAIAAPGPAAGRAPDVGAGTIVAEVPGAEPNPDRVIQD